MVFLEYILHLKYTNNIKVKYLLYKKKNLFFSANLIRDGHVKIIAIPTFSQCMPTRLRVA